MGYAYKPPGFIAGGAKLATTSGTSQSVNLDISSEFWINSAGDIFVAVRSSSTPVTLTLSNSTVMAAGIYGPFHKPDPTSGKWLHIAGNGGTPAVTVTLT
jgi:hypothetical protein